MDSFNTLAGPDFWSQKTNLNKLIQLSEWLGLGTDLAYRTHYA